jgi:hypothetical protein
MQPAVGCRLGRTAFLHVSGLFLFFLSSLVNWTVLRVSKGPGWSVPYPGLGTAISQYHTQRVFVGAQCDFIIMIIKVSVGSYGPIYSSMMSR